MAICPSCGWRTEVTPCPRCGGTVPYATASAPPVPIAPPPYPRTSPPSVLALNMALVAAIIVVVLASAYGGWRAVTGQLLAEPTPVATPSTEPEPAAPPAAPTATVPTVAPPSTPDPATLREQAKVRLEATSEEYPLRTDGHVIVVLSSKYEGVRDDTLVADNGTSTFHYPDIVAEYEQLRATHGSDVHLVKSSTYGLQRANPNVPEGEAIYQTIYDPGTFASIEDAEAWCASTFPEHPGTALDNVCLPRTATPPHG